MLAPYIGKRVCVVTADGRTLVGILSSADQVFNIVLSSCVEREMAPASSYEARHHLLQQPAQPQSLEQLNEVPLGVLMVRGCDVVSIGEVDVYQEARDDSKKWRGFDMPQVRGAAHLTEE